MEAKAQPGACDECNEQMEPRSCFACAGSGQVRVRLLRKDTCAACEGTGTVYRCPNSLKHLADKTSWRNLLKQPPGASPPKPQPVTCTLCHGSGGVPHPATGMPGPCPACGGRGWVLPPG